VALLRAWNPGRIGLTRSTHTSRGESAFRARRNPATSAAQRSLAVKPTPWPIA